MNSPSNPCAYFMCGGGSTERPAFAARDNPPVVCRVFVAGVRRSDGDGMRNARTHPATDGRMDRLHSHPVFAPIPILLPQDKPK